MQRLIVTGYSHNGKPTELTLRFNNGKLLNPRAAAASSIVGWGEWQQSEKVPSHYGDCWYVSTAGHGGYILVSPIKGLPFKEPALKVEHPFGTVYVYEFEEDCDWAILEYQDELARRHALKKYNARRLGHDITESAYIANILVPCLRGWNGWVLDANPDENLVPTT